MEVLTESDVKQMIEEISGQDEVRRRANQKRRHDIYRDDGKKFVIEQITKEFGQQALSEMRVASLNILKKIVNKKSTIYKTPPVRKTVAASDQKLVDFYSKTLELDRNMQKANRYFNLFSNTALYCVPKPTPVKPGEAPKSQLSLHVVPPYLYSVRASQMDPLKAEAFVFNAFTESGQLTPSQDVPSATGFSGWNTEPSFKLAGDKVDSQEKTFGANRNYIFWTELEHFTTDKSGKTLVLDPLKDPNEAKQNPIGMLPVVNLAKERDSEFWAVQGADLAEDSLNFCTGWSDALTVNKNQSFGILTMVSKTEPKSMQFGINKGIWIKQEQEGPQPSVSYLEANSQLGASVDMLKAYLALILETNDLNAGAISGDNKPQSGASGFALMIQMSDALEAVESDKPYLKAAEQELWYIVKSWHNWMLETGVLTDEAKALGKFSDDCQVDVLYRDIRPLESEQERITAVKDLLDLGLLSKADALKKLNPDMDEKMVDAKLAQIEKENQERMKQAMDNMEGEEDPNAPPGGDQEDAEDQGSV